MAAPVPQLLYQGTVPSSAGSMYAPSSSVWVKTIVLCNGNSTAETVDVYANGTSDTANRLFRVVLGANESYTWCASMGLKASTDSIQGKTTTASKVVMTIFGAA
jgi:hypothetical protein